MLIYLTSATWTTGPASSAFAKDVTEAMKLDVHLLLVHEMPGLGGQTERHGCDFGQFFAWYNLAG